jgi:hypothetical protein
MNASHRHHIMLTQISVCSCMRKRSPLPQTPRVLAETAKYGLGMGGAREEEAVISFQSWRLWRWGSEDDAP